MIGIYSLLGRADGSRIADNTIIGGTTIEEGTQTFGIRSLGAQEIEYCNNSIDYIGEGMKFLGNCNNSHITINTLLNLDIGLSLSNFNGVHGQFGVQNGTLNIWEYENDYISFSANNESTGDVDLSKYVVRTIDANNLKFNPTNIFPTSDWFDPTGTVINACNGIGIRINAIDSLVITSEPAFDTLAEPVKFYLKKGVIRKILEEGLESTYSSYLTAVASSSEYILANIENDLKAAFQMDSTDQADLDDLLSQKVVLFDSISVYDSINHAAFNPLIFPAATNFDSIQSKLEQISLLSTYQQSIKSSRMAILVSELGDIEDDLNNLTPRADYDSDYKTIYLLLIKKIVEGHLDAGDYEDLVDIAQNETDSSYANYTAFAYFDLCDANPFLGYSNPQITESPMAEMVDKNVVVTKITEPPSLTHNNYLNFSPDFDGYLMIFDVSGRVVLKTNFQSGSNEIYLGNGLASGVYYYTIFDSTTQLVHSSGVIPLLK